MGDDVARVVLADGSVRFASATNTLVMKRLLPGYLLFATYGVEVPGVRALAMREIEQEIASVGALTIFGDLRGSSRLDAVGREEWSVFGKKHRGVTRRCVMLVESKLLEMAMTVMGLFVGGGVIRTLSNEKEFVSEIARDVPGFRALPDVFRAPRSAVG